MNDVEKHENFGSYFNSLTKMVAILFAIGPPSKSPALFKTLIFVMSPSLTSLRRYFCGPIGAGLEGLNTLLYQGISDVSFGFST